MDFLCSPGVIVYLLLLLSRLFTYSDASDAPVVGTPDDLSPGTSISQPAESTGQPELEPPQDTQPPQDTEPPQDTQPPQDAGPAVQNNTLYVLMYHHLITAEEYCGTWTITDTRFREDLQWLADHGYTTVLPSELIAGKPLPAKAVMITLDDGYRSNYELAYPLLQEFQAKAAISIVTQYTVDQSPSFLTWEMCQEMVRSGLVEIGSHTNNCHGDQGLKRQQGETKAAYQERVLPDLQASIDLIRENVGVEPQFFAYPNGIKDAWASDFIADHFAITLITRSGPADISKGLYSLPRYNVAMGCALSNILP